MQSQRPFCKVRDRSTIGCCWESFHGILIVHVIGFRFVNQAISKLLSNDSIGIKWLYWLSGDALNNPLPHGSDVTHHEMQRAEQAGRRFIRMFEKGSSLTPTGFGYT